MGFLQKVEEEPEDLYREMSDAAAVILDAKPES